MRKIIKKLMQPGDTLSQRMIRSGFWVVFYKIFERGFRFIKTMVIARILAPSDFGLFGISFLALDILETFTETGISSALVQKKEDIENYLNTAWTIQILRAFLIFIVVFICAPFIAKFFNNPQAGPLTRVIAFTMLISGFVNIGVVYFIKEIEFAKQRLLSFSKLVTEFTISISLAFILRNVWALVWGMLAGKISYCLASYMLHPYRPKLHIELKKTKELMHFGKWIFFSTILTFLVTQGDDIFVGKMLGTTALGFYTMAYAISNLAATEVTHLISQILFPAYSKLQQNIVKLRESYFTTIGVVSLITIPLTIIIVIFGRDFTIIFLGYKWVPMVIAMQLLAISGLIRAMIATGGSLFNGVGKPRLDFKMNIYRLITMIICIYPLTKFFGIEGASFVIILSTTTAIPVWFHESKKITNALLRDFSQAILPSVFASIIITIFALLIRTVFIDLGVHLNYLTIFFEIFLVLFIYVLIIILSGKIFRISLIEKIKLLKLSI